jgi:hypothetical protein
MEWEPPFEAESGLATMEAPFEMNVKLADIRDGLAAIRFAVEDEDDGEEEEESD